MCIILDKSGDGMAEKLSDQKLAMICASELFRGVDEIVVEQIVSNQNCRCLRFSKGQTFEPVMELSRAMGIVLSGSVRMEKTVRQAETMKLILLRPGDCFGGGAMFLGGGMRTVAFTAASGVEALQLPQEILTRAMRRNFTVTENYIRYLSGQIRILDEILSDLTAGPAEKRLALFLVERCGEDGEFQGTKTELSRQLNMGRATLYRALGNLEREGLLACGNKKIQIIDFQGLRQAAGGE